jgi:hypothetical protein
MGVLLSENNQKYFSEKYPIIYKSRLEKKDGSGYCYSNPIQIAFK